jgi:hypothetical protein
MEMKLLNYSEFNLKFRVITMLYDSDLKFSNMIGRYHTPDNKYQWIVMAHCFIFLIYNLFKKYICTLNISNNSLKN